MSQRKTVLIADEDRALVQTLADRCKRLNLEVRTAYDGPNTLTNFLFGRLDLICLGTNLAGSRGGRVCDTIVNDAIRATVPLVTLTDPIRAEDPFAQPSAVDDRTYQLEKTEDVADRVEDHIARLLLLEDRLAEAV